MAASTASTATSRRTSRHCVQDIAEGVDCPRPVAWRWWPYGRRGTSAYLCDDHAAARDLSELEDLASPDSGRPGTRTSTRLTDADRSVIAKARELAALDGPAVRAYTGYDDAGLACAAAFGRAQVLLAQLAELTERLAGE